MNKNHNCFCRSCVPSPTCELKKVAVQNIRVSKQNKSLQLELNCQKEALEIALLGLKRLADVSDDFVYTKAFYCCEFAQGIVNRVNEALKKAAK